MDTDFNKLLNNYFNEKLKSAIITKCSKCKNEQIIFEKAASNVTCSVCKEILAKSTGGKSNVIAKVIKEL